jgi:hypothetical protein
LEKGEKVEEMNMNRDELKSYLNDHLAGSVGALELLDRLIDTYKAKPLGRFFSELRAEVDADQGKLQGLIDQLDAEESSVRKAGAWVMEKLSRPKIQLSESREGEMGLFLALEALALGIAGKQSLWRALAIASETAPRLRVLDYAELEKRALEQHAHVETKRLEVAREVFKSG